MLQAILVGSGPDRASIGGVVVAVAADAMVHRTVTGVWPEALRIGGGNLELEGNRSDPLKRRCPHKLHVTLDERGC